MKHLKCNLKEIVQKVKEFTIRVGVSWQQLLPVVCMDHSCHQHKLQVSAMVSHVDKTKMVLMMLFVCLFGHLQQKGICHKVHQAGMLWPVAVGSVFVGVVCFVLLLVCLFSVFINCSSYIKANNFACLFLSACIIYFELASQWPLPLLPLHCMNSCNRVIHNVDSCQSRVILLTP